MLQPPILPYYLFSSKGGGRGVQTMKAQSCMYDCLLNVPFEGFGQDDPRKQLCIAPVTVLKQQLLRKSINILAVSSTTETA